MSIRIQDTVEDKIKFGGAKVVVQWGNTTEIIHVTDDVNILYKQLTPHIQQGFQSSPDNTFISFYCTDNILHFININHIIDVMFVNPK